jgi:hypothetical protein
MLTATQALPSSTRKALHCKESGRVLHITPCNIRMATSGHVQSFGWCLVCKLLLVLASRGTPCAHEALSPGN